MYNTCVNRLPIISFIVVGLIFLISGFLLNNYNNSIIKNTKEIEANVIKVEKYRVSVSFDEDKTLAYTAFFNKEKINDKVIVYCKNNKCKTKHAYELSNIFIIIGFIVSIVSIFVFIKTSIKYRKYNKTINNQGIKIMAKIISIEVDTSVENNSLNPYYVVCNAINPFNNKEENYTSEYVWFDIRKVIEDNKITHLPVYIDEKNTENYHVDISSLKESIRSR